MSNYTRLALEERSSVARFTSRHGIQTYFCGPHACQARATWFQATRSWLQPRLVGAIALTADNLSRTDNRFAALRAAGDSHIAAARDTYIGGFGGIHTDIA